VLYHAIKQLLQLQAKEASAFQGLLNRYHELHGQIQNLKRMLFARPTDKNLRAQISRAGGERSRVYRQMKSMDPEATTKALPHAHDIDNRAAKRAGETNRANASSNKAKNSSQASNQAAPIAQSTPPAPPPANRKPYQPTLFGLEGV